MGRSIEFDDIADCYDATRGGETRGDEYAADIDRLIPETDGVILEIGVGTGVVALGLKKRGRRVVGVDLSQQMIRRAVDRLGATVARSDALEMSIGTACIDHAVSVWVVHAVKDPVGLFEEAARVLKPGGKYVVSPNQRTAEDDRISALTRELFQRIDVLRGATRPRGVTASEVLGWAEKAGFRGEIHEFRREWTSPPSDEIRAIETRAWPAMRELDEATIEEVTRPTIEALRSLPDVDADVTRSAVVSVVVLTRA